MALKNLKLVGPGGAGGKDLVTAVKELQGLKQVVVDGAAGGADIAVPGLLATAHLVSVLNISDFGAYSGSAVVHAAGVIRIGGTTATKKLLVTYFNK